MCVAAAGKIIEIRGTVARVDIMHNICEADIRLVDAKVGDYVLIHAGFALEILKMDRAQEMMDIFAELEKDAYETT